MILREEITGNSAVHRDRRPRQYFTALCQLTSHDSCREQPWLLKNSLAESARKNRRARMTYKRFSPDADTFLVIRFKPVFGKTEFFNSYSDYHSQS